MKQKLQRFVYLVATKIPLPWRVRTFLAAIYIATRDGLKGFGERLEGKKPITARPGRRSYFLWRKRHFKKLKKSLFDFSGQHSFHIFIEQTSGTRHSQLKKTIRSIEHETEGHSEFTVVPSGTDVSPLIAASAADFIMFMKPGSTLHRLALKKISSEFSRTPSAGVMTFDSDLKKFGRRSKPLFRPVFSPEMLFSANYLNFAFAARKSLFSCIQPIILSNTGVWEFLLRCYCTKTTFIQTSSLLLSESPRQRSYEITQDSAEMVQTVLSRGLDINFEVKVLDGHLRVLPHTSYSPPVSIVIPTRHSTENISQLFDSLGLTNYPNFNVCVIDNGTKNQKDKKWYDRLKPTFDYKVLWWDVTPFNYSAVNNFAARNTDGDIIIFLNDDTQIVDPHWLSELVGYLSLPDIGTAGFQLRNHEGLIQHGGVMLGPGGFADNLFSGLKPHSWTLMGSTDWYRDSLAVTGACVAITRENFESVGGFDERFELCGSDVVLGLDMVVRGKRNIVSPIDAVRHFESLTRGTAVPVGDFFASYWRYLPWLQNGDPFVSPNISQLAAIPRLSDDRDDLPVVLAMQILGRPYREIKQSGSIGQEAKNLLTIATITPENKAEIVELNNREIKDFSIKTINWFLPDIDTPFFGGFNTAFRIASHLERDHGVKNRFIFLAPENENFFRSAVVAAFPNLKDSEFGFYDTLQGETKEIPHADAAVATLWLTAYLAAKTKTADRYFYLIQDFEPGFYPASSMYAFAEQSYRLGFYGICNTTTLAETYKHDYSGSGLAFTPAVDRRIYFPEERERDDDQPVRIFVYARDHFRNCSELALGALEQIKDIYGDKVEIIVAGARYLKSQSKFVNLGLMDYRESATLFRTIDIGLTLQISQHPSYLPLELMACGVPMVAPKSKDFSWLFQDRENSVLTDMTLDGVVESLSLLIENKALRKELSKAAISTIDSSHSSWEKSLEGIHYFMTNRA
jgi:GT2 family glycosyltransferase/glycosyltransferase involved in cell wall biosynthesis